MATIKCDYIDPVTQVTCGFVPKSGNAQGLSMHQFRMHGQRKSTDEQAAKSRERRARDRARKREARAGDIPAVSTNGSGPTVTAKQRQRALDDLVLMVQMLYPQGISTKDPADVAAFLAWCGDTTETLIKRGAVR